MARSAIGSTVRHWSVSCEPLKLMAFSACRRPWAQAQWILQRMILKDLGSYDNDLVRVLHGFANAIDAINSLRNNGSIAHPSEDLLGEPEAHLAVNATRTIFNYIRAKVGH